MILEINHIRDALRRMHLEAGQVQALTALSVADVLFESLSLGLLYPVLLVVESGAEAVLARGNIVVEATAVMLAWTGLEFSLAPLLCVVFLVLITRQALLFQKSHYAARLGHEACANIQREGLKAFLHTDIGFYFRHNRASVHAALRGHATRAAGMVPSGADAASSLVLLAAYVVLLTVVSPWLSLAAVLISLPVGLMFRFRMHAGRELGNRLSLGVERLSTEMFERLNAIRLVKMRGMESRSADEIDAVIDSLRKLNTETDRIRLSMEAAAYPLLFAGVIFTFYLSVTYLGMTLAGLGFFIYVVIRMLPVLVRINSLRFQLNHGLDAVAKIDKIVSAARREATVASGTRRFHGLQDGIEFRSVCFSYDTGESVVPAVQDLSFTIRRGTMVALVGRSGAGKSTTADLIPRFFDPTAGEIRFDGVPAHEYDIRSLRRAIAFVTQDTILLDDTIRANLEFGLSHQLDEDTIARVLRLSHCDEFIDSLPRGVDTVIGERGTRLSGGQRQRLSFARALACDPDILVLDEPTSALDSESETFIQGTLESLRGQVTTVAIAHRLATIAQADLILMLESGRLIAQGSHGVLVRESDQYRRLFSTQIDL